MSTKKHNALNIDFLPLGMAGYHWVWRANNIYRILCVYRNTFDVIVVIINRVCQSVRKTHLSIYIYHRVLLKRGWTLKNHSLFRICCI